MRNLVLAVLATVTLVAGTAHAHHSPVVFDHTKKITIVGTVTEFKWMSPHSWIHIDVTDDNGEIHNWGVEMDPASLLARGGWKSNSIKPGDKVSILIYPLRNNEKGGQYISITLPDGTKLGTRESKVL
jgi:Family of unknown function (DUF6152)